MIDMASPRQKTGYEPGQRSIEAIELVYSPAHVFILIVSRRVPRLLALVAGLLAVVVPATAHAQRRPESARIQVRLSSADAPMPVVVRLTSRANSAATPAEGDSRDGIATFSGLTPGAYRIELGGRSGVILLNPREVAVIDADSLEVLERRATGEGTHLTRRWFDDLASAGDLWSLIETTAPFVIADRMDNGGLGTGRSALLGSRGSSWTTARVMVGGANAIAPNLHGQMPFNPDLFAADSISIVTGRSGGGGHASRARAHHARHARRRIHDARHGRRQQTRICAVAVLHRRLAPWARARRRTHWRANGFPAVAGELTKQVS
jgi:hypothetical protein